MYRSQIQIWFIRALVKGWLLLENSVSRSFSSKINFGCGEFRWCSLFHKQFDCPYLHRIWSKVEFVRICPKFLCQFQKQENCFFLKIVTWHSKLKLWLEIFYLWKLFYILILNWRSFSLLERLRLMAKTYICV